MYICALRKSKTIYNLEQKDYMLFDLHFILLLLNLNMRSLVGVIRKYLYNVTQIKRNNQIRL